MLIVLMPMAGKLMLTDFLVICHNYMKARLKKTTVFCMYGQDLVLCAFIAGPPCWPYTKCFYFGINPVHNSQSFRLPDTVLLQCRGCQSARNSGRGVVLEC